LDILEHDVLDDEQFANLTPGIFQGPVLDLFAPLDNQFGAAQARWLP
jgi:hypothetical protein